MKIPQVVGKNKIRDAKILQLYINDAWTMREIAEHFKISEVRVSKIIYQNSALVKFESNHEKVKRLNTLRRMLRKHPDELGKKSTLDIVDSIRTEIDGKDGIPPPPADTKVIIIRESTQPVAPTREIPDGDPSQRGDVSRQISVVRV